MLEVKGSEGQVGDLGQSVDGLRGVCLKIALIGPSL